MRCRGGDDQPPPDLVSNKTNTGGTGWSRDGVLPSAVSAGVQEIRGPVREPEPEIRLLPLPVVRVRGLDRGPHRRLQGAEVRGLQRGADRGERCLFELGEVLRVLRTGLRHLVEQLRGLPPLVPREVPVPATRGVRHHPEPPGEDVHQVRQAVLELRDLVHGELRVAGLPDDAVSRDLLLPRHRLTAPALRDSAGAEGPFRGGGWCPHLWSLPYNYSFREENVMNGRRNPGAVIRWSQASTSRPASPRSSRISRW